MAVGIVIAGSTFGQFTFIPLFTVIVTKYGWRRCYIALPVTASLVIPSYLLLPKESQNQISQRNAALDMANAKAEREEGQGAPASPSRGRGSSGRGVRGKCGC